MTDYIRTSLADVDHKGQHPYMYFENIVPKRLYWKCEIVSVRNENVQCNMNVVKKFSIVRFKTLHAAFAK